MAKLSENEKLNKIFPAVAVLWNNITDNDCCSYINSMVHALCGHYELYEVVYGETIYIDAAFIACWMDLCNSNSITERQVKTLFFETVQHFANELEDVKEDSCYLEQEFN
ncbi:MAG: hypothetical protein ACEQSR_03825 [Candidatus Methylacidiphilales bacterium]